MTIDDVCKLTDDLLTWVAEKNPSTTVDALRKKFDTLLEVKTKRIKSTIFNCNSNFQLPFIVAKRLKKEIFRDI